MKNISIAFVLMVAMFSTGFAQKTKIFKYPFVNQTEFGLLPGRVKEMNYYYPYYYSYYPNPVVPEQTYTTKNVASLSLQTFNGFKIRKNTTLGLTVGIDSYASVLVTPIALGIRQIMVEKSDKGAKLQLGIDAGYGSTVFNPKNSQTETNGGIMLNPAIGFIFPTKNGSAWLVNFGYKYQYLELNSSYPEDYYYSVNETRNLNRLQIRLGFEF
ncbi:MAG: hypothetical protein IPO04_06415 [Cytophagaceae bacterium]|nr:hypothetical protein [Cytophagaceae bacterium]